VQTNLIKSLLLILSLIFTTDSSATADIDIVDYIVEEEFHGSVVKILVKNNMSMSKNLIFQFNVNDSGCQRIKRDDSLVEYPYTGSESYRRVITSGGVAYTPLYLQNYTLAFPCKNLKLYVIDGDSPNKDIIFVYEIKNKQKKVNKDMFISQSDSKTLFIASKVIDYAIRGELIIYNDTDKTLKLDDFDISLVCDGAEVVLGEDLIPIREHFGTVSPQNFIVLMRALRLKDKITDIKKCELAGVVTVDSGQNKNIIVKNDVSEEILSGVRVRLFPKEL